MTITQACLDVVKNACACKFKVLNRYKRFSISSRETDMPTGSQGQKRLADAIGNDVQIMRIATGEIQDTTKFGSGKPRSGIAGAKARTKSLIAEERTAIAQKAATARWKV